MKMSIQLNLIPAQVCTEVFNVAYCPECSVTQVLSTGLYTSLKYYIPGVLVMLHVRRQGHFVTSILLERVFMHCIYLAKPPLSFSLTLQNTSQFFLHFTKSISVFLLDQPHCHEFKGTHASTSLTASNCWCGLHAPHN